MRCAPPSRTMRAMPAPLDWTPAGGIEAVRTLTVAVGPREAARRLMLSPAHAEALRKTCTRGRWMDAVRPVAPPPMPASMRQLIVQRVPSSVSPSVMVSPNSVPSLQSEVVPNVPTASQALAESLADDERETRISLARSVRGMAQQAENADLDESGSVHGVAKTAAILFRWADDGSRGQRVSIYDSQVAIISGSPEQ